LCKWDVKSGEPARCGPAESGLEAGNVRGLEPLGPLGHFKFDSLAVGQRLVAFALDSGEVHEDILAGEALDESKTLAGVKPLYSSLFFQFSYSLCV
jgi:hypothetical protein